VRTGRRAANSRPPPTVSPSKKHEITLEECMGGDRAHALGDVAARITRSTPSPPSPSLCVHLWSCAAITLIVAPCAARALPCGETLPRGLEQAWVTTGKPMFVVRFILGGRRTTHFVVQFIFWRMTKSVCRAFYFLAHGKLSFSLPLPRRQTSLAFVVRQAKAHDRDILFTMCFPPAHDKHILLPCVFLKHTTKYF
jgi:hypothetical protein